MGYAGLRNLFTENPRVGGSVRGGRHWQATPVSGRRIILVEPDLLENRVITTAFGLALASLVVVMGALIQYFSTIPRGKVPVKPIALVTFLSIGMGLAVIAIVKSFSGSALSIVAVLIPSALVLLMASGIFWLLSQRKTPIGDLKVKLGDKLLSFDATTSEGVPFHADELAGKRTLLKFFRGGWCPYCSAELEAFDAMLPDLEAYGVRVIALSKDSVAEAAIHKTRDNLSLTLLSDPNLDVIRQYGVEHHKALGGITDSSKMFGIPLAAPTGFSAMAIPTSLLIDENGVIQWIDQSDDYRLRSSNSLVLEAVKSAFG